MPSNPQSGNSTLSDQQTQTPSFPFDSDAERVLVQRIQDAFSKTDLLRMKELVAINEEDSLTPVELAEYTQLSQRLFQANTSRLKAINELATLRGSSFEATFSEFDDGEHWNE